MLEFRFLFPPIIYLLPIDSQIIYLRFRLNFFAIFIALKIVSKFKDSRKYVIFSDSVDSLQLLYSSNTDILPEILDNTLSIINIKPDHYYFCYIPAHCNFRPHDIADNLAKLATSFSNINFNLNIKQHEIYNIIDKHFLSEWSNLSNTCLTGKLYIQYFYPPKNIINKNINWTRRKEVTFHRLRLLNCNLKYYRYKMGLTPSPLCSHCFVQETIEHFLLECSQHSTLHYNLKMACLQLNCKLDIPTILSNISLYNIIFHYISVNNIYI